MQFDDLDGKTRKTVEEVLGYLNFSSGAPDPLFLGGISALFGWIEADAGRAEPSWRALAAVLGAALDRLRGDRDAFQEVDQAQAVLALVFDRVLPAYRRHHRDLLFHQSEEQLFQPFFIGRVCEAVLRQGGPWDEQERVVQGSLSRLNDFLGHRPVAVLETDQEIQPYAHERVRPTPLYIREVGVAWGTYGKLIERALAILQQTDPALLHQAFFDLEQLDELALDPRAYDFDHPINKRPNYLFGQWDMHCLDNSGRCRRFVLQQVALDAMLARVQQRGETAHEEALFEAAAVLAGTMLMGSGVSGNRPGAHHSTTTLATLVQHIAAYRDAFYEQLIGRLAGPHAKRLRAEARRLQQPFGGARQDFNHQLARHRSEQLQHVQLAQLFARMGYTEAAARQVRVVPVVSARMQSDIHCRITAAHQEADGGRLDCAAAMLPEIEDLLHRAIECGALVDPWNILGFAGQYSLFPAPENSVPDHRIDELIELVGAIFDLYVHIQKEAAAAGSTALQRALSTDLDKLARWWDQFACLEVGSVEGISGQATNESAEHVAAALRAWHEAGTAAGDIGFWRERIQRFRSPKSYALVIEALLQQRDPVAAMALLVQWVSQADQIPLIEEDYAFHDLALRWMDELWATEQADDEQSPRGSSGGEQSSEPPAATHDRWELSRKFFDYLEANAEEYWQVPRFELDGQTDNGVEENSVEENGDEEETESLFGAAYEGVTYRDSTDDGFDGELFEGGHDATDSQLLCEAERIVARLAFLATLARLWKSAAAASLGEGTDPQHEEALAGWLDRAIVNRRQLLRLLAAVHRYRIPPPRGTQEAMIEFDRRRGVKEMLIEQIIGTIVETADAVCVIRAAVPPRQPATEQKNWEETVGEVLRAALRGDVAMVRRSWTGLIDALREQPLLYVALAKGGNPRRIVASRSIQRALRRLLEYLPRLGLIGETVQLLDTIHHMESDHPVGEGAITEFDRMFQIGCRGIVRCLAVSSEQWHATARRCDADLIDSLENATKSLMKCWLAHSRGVRLSVLDSVSDEDQWRSLRRFIERYGSDLFVQQFMNLGSLRAILHQGVDAYLRSLEEEPDAEEDFRLLAELDGPIAREDAVVYLSVALESVVENYAQYIDYNSTTTQSDRGEMLYTLLDFLRLRASYDRVAWNLQPVVLAHEVLVRCGRDNAAETWRAAVARRTDKIADEHQKRYVRLTKKYGMRLPSIAERLSERFVRPLLIDRLCALVGPAMDQLRDGQETTAFEYLEKGVSELTAQPGGAGFEVPGWLEALQQEVDRAGFRESEEEDDDVLAPYLSIPQVRLSRDEMGQWKPAQRASKPPKKRGH